MEATSPRLARMRLRNFPRTQGALGHTHTHGWHQDGERHCFTSKFQVAGTIWTSKAQRRTAWRVLNELQGPGGEVEISACKREAEDGSHGGGEGSCTSSSTVNTTMMRSRSNDVIWREIPDRPTGKTRSAIPSSCARPTRTLDAIVFSAGASSSGNEVKATSLYVADRTAIVASLMPKGDMGQSSDERKDPRREKSKMKHVCCREIQPRGGPQKTDRGAGRVARPRWCVKWTLPLDRKMVDLR